MKKNRFPLFLLIVSSLILWGAGKSYLTYNLSHYAGYYVQQLPRQEGTNPELVIILEHLRDIERPVTNQLTYDLEGKGTIVLDNAVILSRERDIQLWNRRENKNYVFNDFGEFSYYYTDDSDHPNFDIGYQKEAELLLESLLIPILEAQPEPKINLQKLFNEKYARKFN